MKTNKTEKLENMKNASSQFGYDLENYCSVIPLKEITQSTDGSKKFDSDLEKYLTTSIIAPGKFQQDLKKFNSDLKRCFIKVLKDFPEFSNIMFEIVTTPKVMSYLNIFFYYDENGRLLHPRGAVYTIFCGSGGIRTFYDDDSKEGALAHELGEVVHLLKKGAKGLLKTREWYEKHLSYRELVQMNADMIAARRGYDHKLVKALYSFKHQSEYSNHPDLDARIKNLEGYLKK